MNAKDNSAPAFPQNTFTPMPGGGGYWSHDGGMTLRDWFAGQALTGLMVDITDAQDIPKAAVIAFAVADAMLESRK